MGETFQRTNQLVKKTKVNKEGRNEYFLWNNLPKTAQKDKRNFTTSKFIVIIMKGIILWKKTMKSFFCNVLIFRSSHSQVFFRRVVLKNFASFKEKHLCWSLFLIQLQTLRPATLSKRDFNTGVFLWNWRSFFMNSFFYRTPPVAASVVFAPKQRNIQCYNHNFWL